MQPTPPREIGPLQDAVVKAEQTFGDAVEALEAAEDSVIAGLLAELDGPRAVGSSARERLRLEMDRLKDWLRLAKKVLPLTPEEISAMKSAAGKKSKGRKGSKKPSARTYVLDSVKLREMQGGLSNAAFARWLDIPASTITTIKLGGVANRKNAVRIIGKAMRKGINGVILGYRSVAPGRDTAKPKKLNQAERTKRARRHFEMARELSE